MGHKWVTNRLSLCKYYIIVVVLSIVNIYIYLIKENHGIKTVESLKTLVDNQSLTLISSVTRLILTV